MQTDISGYPARVRWVTDMTSVVLAAQSTLLLRAWALNPVSMRKLHQHLNLHAGEQGPDELRRIAVRPTTLLLNLQQQAACIMHLPGRKCYIGESQHAGRQGMSNIQATQVERKSRPVREV
jgi:hypothetical protein